MSQKQESRWEGKPRKELGPWEVKRTGESEILLKLPEGMTIQGEELVIEDLLGAISNYMVVKSGRVLACCSGNIAIA
jgi:diphthamide synthase subunit DPH2